MMKLEMEEINARRTGTHHRSIKTGAGIGIRRDTREVIVDRMQNRGWLAGAALLLVMVGSAFSVGLAARDSRAPMASAVSANGTVEEVLVTGEAPSLLSGMQPEVVVLAKVPEGLRGMLDEVSVVAPGPGSGLPVVVSYAPGPEFRLDEVVVRAEAPWELSGMPEVVVTPEWMPVAGVGLVSAGRIVN